MTRAERPVLYGEQVEGQSSEATPPLTDGETKQALGMLTRCDRTSSSHVQILTFSWSLKQIAGRKGHVPLQASLSPCHKMAVEHMGSWFPMPEPGPEVSGTLENAKCGLGTFFEPVRK